MMTSRFVPSYRQRHLEPAGKCVFKRCRFISGGKVVFHCSALSISAEPLAQTLSPQLHFNRWPLDGPFNQGITPSILPRHYRHHCPQNGWQLLEIPGCVTTLRCTCCAVHVPPVLMPQQPERQRRIIPAPAREASWRCRLALEVNNLPVMCSSILCLRDTK